jgi:hypothetical protein
VVNATAATLNNGDQLIVGGLGTLALYGSGTFRVDQLAAFSGFSNITLNNYTNGTATLYLGSQPITVTGLGSGNESLYLGSGQTTFNGGSGYNVIWSLSNSTWNSADVINGGNYGQLYLDWSIQANVTYDLTANTFRNINSLYGYGDNLTLKINSADASGVSNFYGEGANDQLVTSDATLDLSHTDVSNFAVLSTNATGTTFTVKDVATAFAIAGGPGQDTIVANGFAFTADQRNAIFATASIEKIIDTSGTYTAAGPVNPPPAPTVIELTTGNDVVNSSLPNLVVNASAATLNDGDQLSAGGSGTLALYGSGTFHVDQLATFSGFSNIALNNYTNGYATLYLGSQPVTVTGLGSGNETLYLGNGQTTYNGGSGYDQIISLSAETNWNSADAINAGTNGGDLYLNYSGANRAYDLTGITLQNINNLYGEYDVVLKMAIMMQRSITERFVCTT